MIKITDSSIFHVHTYRCRHAENVPDEQYIEKAIQLGASDIWFTDHAPFSGDPFGLRMAYQELSEYIAALSGLKQKYADIRIHIGLETEYFPSFDAQGYYRYLRAIPELEILLLGQHMAEIETAPPRYSFSETAEYLAVNEYKLLGHAMIQGIRSGYFDAVAHPDRIFRRCTAWDCEMEKMSRAIIQSAAEHKLPLEMNLSSVENQKNYKPQFWTLVPIESACIIGYDAHTVAEMETRYHELNERLKRFRALSTFHSTVII